MAIDNNILQSITALMSDVDPGNQQYQLISEILHQFKDFLEKIVDSDPDEISSLNEELENKFKKMPFIMELGGIVRRFYSQFQNLQNEISGKLQNVKNLNILPATERLHHVVEMTENAANKTLDLTEEMLNSINDHADRKNDLITALEKATGGESSQEETQKVLGDVLGYLKESQEQDNIYNEKMTEILLAQDYQDLTGQVIGKIITLIENMERELLELMDNFKKANIQLEEQIQGMEEQQVAEQPIEDLVGPLSNSVQQRQDQGDVDKLLAEMGFG